MGGVSDPAESPEEPTNGSIGGVRFPALPFDVPPYTQGRIKFCSNMESEDGSGTEGIIIIP
jgi:hypothetical protein